MKSNISLSVKIYVWIFIYCCFVHSVAFAVTAFVLSIILAVVPVFTSKLLMIPSLVIVGCSFFFGDRSFALWTLGFMPCFWIMFADSVMKIFD